MSCGSSHTGDCYSSLNTLGSTFHPRTTTEMADFYSDVRVPIPRLVIVASISLLLCFPTQSMSRLSFCTDHSKKRRSRISALHTSVGVASPQERGAATGGHWILPRSSVPARQAPHPLPVFDRSGCA